LNRHLKNYGKKGKYLELICNVWDVMMDDKKSKDRKYFSVMGLSRNR